MMKQLEQLTIIAKMMVAEEKRVEKVLVEIDETVFGSQIGVVRIFTREEDGRLKENSEPFEWMELGWISLLEPFMESRLKELS